MPGVIGLRQPQLVRALNNCILSTVVQFFAQYLIDRVVTHIMTISQM